MSKNERIRKDIQILGPYLRAKKAVPHDFGAL